MFNQKKKNKQFKLTTKQIAESMFVFPSGDLKFLYIIYLTWSFYLTV